MSWVTNNLKDAGIGIGILTIIIAVMAKVLGTMQDQNIAYATYNASNSGTWTHAVNITNAGSAALGTFGSWFSVIVIVLIAAAVIMLLTFGFGQGSRQ